MVRQEVKAAYAQLSIPCIVEHAGLIFADYKDHNYPGGLTKPMWNALGAAYHQGDAFGGTLRNSSCGCRLLRWSEFLHFRRRDARGKLAQSPEETGRSTGIRYLYLMMTIPAR